MAYELAQVNFSRLLAPLDSPVLRDFVADLDAVNAAADAAPGFRWRLQGEGGNATDVEAFGWDAGDSAGVIVNMSVWTDVETLAAYVYGDLHRRVLRRRRDWFEKMSAPTTTCWWVPAGVRPTTADAEDRIRTLRRRGPSPAAFTLQRHFPPPDDAGHTVARTASGDWLCPA